MGETLSEEDGHVLHGAALGHPGLAGGRVGALAADRARPGAGAIANQAERSLPAACWPGAAKRPTAIERLAERLAKCLATTERLGAGRTANSGAAPIGESA